MKKLLIIVAGTGPETNNLLIYCSNNNISTTKWEEYKNEGYRVNEDIKTVFIVSNYIEDIHEVFRFISKNKIPLTNLSNIKITKHCDYNGIVVNNTTSHVFELASNSVFNAIKEISPKNLISYILLSIRIEEKIPKGIHVLK